MGCPLDVVAQAERDLLLVAGDLAEGTRAFDWLREQAEFSPVVFLAGNHEYYGYDIDEMDKIYTEFSDSHPNIHFLQCGVYEQEGVRIAGCTLWTDFTDVDGYHRRHVERSMTDFSGAIRMGDKRFTTDMSAMINMKHRNWLLQQTDIDIVVTHHAPSDQSITDYWKENGALLNPGFAGNSEDIMDALSPTYWIHGHMHSFLRYWHEGKVDGIQVLCNPRGYGGSYQERTGWFDNLLITV